MNSTYKLVVKNGSYSYNAVTGSYETKDFVETYDDFPTALYEFHSWIQDESSKVTLTYKPNKKDMK